MREAARAFLKLGRLDDRSGLDDRYELAFVDLLSHSPDPLF